MAVRFKREGEARRGLLTQASAQKQEGRGGKPVRTGWHVNSHLPPRSMSFPTPRPLPLLHFQILLSKNI